jgi:hypothetical protein
MTFEIAGEAEIDLRWTISHQVTYFFAIVTTDFGLVFCAVATFVSNVVTAITPLLGLTTITCEMANTVAFVALLTESSSTFASIMTGTVAFVTN